MQLVVRSSLAIKGIMIEGGVIDADYRGEIKLVVRNQSAERIIIKGRGKAIAQMMIIKIALLEVIEVSELDQTERLGGFGSIDCQEMPKVELSVIVKKREQHPKA